VQRQQREQPHVRARGRSQRLSAEARWHASAQST